MARLAVITEVPFSAATNPIDTVPQSDPGSEVLQTVVDDDAMTLCGVDRGPILCLVQVHGWNGCVVPGGSD